MTIKLIDVIDAIDHRGRQIHEGEMGLWVRASEWDLVREAMRHSSSEAAEKELLWAAMDAVKWLDSHELRDTLTQAGNLSMTHPHLSTKISPEFGVWAAAVLARFRAAVNRHSDTEESK